MLVPFPLHILPWASLGQRFSFISIYPSAQHSAWPTFTLQFCTCCPFLSPFHHLSKVSSSSNSNVIYSMKHFWIRSESISSLFRATKVLYLHLNDQSHHNSFCPCSLCTPERPEGCEKMEISPRRVCLPSNPRRTVSPALAVSVFVPLRNLKFADEEHNSESSKAFCLHPTASK